MHRLKKMLDADMAITLTTDSNPGSCPTANLQFANAIRLLIYEINTC